MFGLFGNKEVVDFKELIKKGAVIIDVRSKDEFGGGHVKGAINIPLDVLDKNIDNIGGGDTHIITCCLSGGRSTMAKNILNARGFNNVHNGGGWQSLQNKLA